MQGFQETFEAYGADYAATMERFMGNEAMYLRFLDMLFQDENLSKLGEALDGGDLQSAFAAAHTLKGVAANMGLTPLYAAVCAIVEPLRAGTPGCAYAALYAGVQQEFQKVRALRDALKGGGAA